MMLTEKEKRELEQQARNKKVLAISLAASAGTMLLAALIWYAIFSSQFAVFTEDVHHIKIKYPSNWSVAKGYEGTVVAFVSPKEHELDGLQENLNIAITDLSLKPMTLQEYTDLAIKQMEAVFDRNIQVVESKPISIVGQQGYKYVVRGPPPLELVITFILFIKDNEAYTITYMGQTIQYEKFRAKFDEMVRSFSILTP